MIYATKTFLSVFICILIMLKFFFVVKFISFSFAACKFLIKKIFSYPAYIKVNPYFLLISVKFYFVYRSLVNLITMGDQLNIHWKD